MTVTRVMMLLLFAASLLSCTPPDKTTTTAVFKPAPVKDEDGTELREPEKVRSEHVQLDNFGLKTITVGNANGDYVLECNMKADNCLTPVPGKDYYVFDKNAKWKMPGAATSITLSWIQDWSVKYNSGESIALVPVEGGTPQETGMYWLNSWSADTKSK